MINIQTLEVSGFKGAIHGMRHPMKSENKSDSGVYDTDYNGYPIFTIGAEDLKLCQKLLASGKDDDSKFMRMIHVQCDIFAPLYWWKEMDTYKVSTVANSESTMHTIHRSKLGLEDFSHEMVLDDYTLDDQEWDPQTYLTPMEVQIDTIDMLNHTRDLYLEACKAKDGKKAHSYWYNLIQTLPSSYMQMRTWDANYQTIRRIYFARKGHKLKEWYDFREWVMSLPYAEELIAYEPEKEIPGFDLEAFYQKRKVLRERGLTDADIAKEFCLNTPYYRILSSASNDAHKEKEHERIADNTDS
jgi:hypothetical protein